MLSVPVPPFFFALFSSGLFEPGASRRRPWLSSSPSRMPSPMNYWLLLSSSSLSCLFWFDSFCGLFMKKNNSRRSVSKAQEINVALLKVKALELVRFCPYLWLRDVKGKNEIAAASFRLQFIKSFFSKCYFSFIEKWRIGFHHNSQHLLLLHWLWVMTANG